MSLYHEQMPTQLVSAVGLDRAADKGRGAGLLRMERRNVGSAGDATGRPPHSGVKFVGDDPGGEKDVFSGDDPGGEKDVFSVQFLVTTRVGRRRCWTRYCHWRGQDD